MLFVTCLFLLMSILTGFSVDEVASQTPLTTIQLVSNRSFCFFLPPKQGDDVGATEEHGIPHCTDTTLSSARHVFPKGLIRSAHYVKKPDYVQVTGRLNRSRYKLHATDGGGQYDNKDVHDVVCNGYKYWVNMLEPDVNQYCIRCCKKQADCNLGISTFGCERVVPGIYT